MRGFPAFYFIRYHSKQRSFMLRNQIIQFLIWIWEKWRSSSSIARWIFRAPFIIGFFGFMAAGYSIFNSAYFALDLYLLDLDIPYDQVNILIEIARWAAPFVMISGIMLSVSSIWDRMRHFIFSLRKNTTVIYSNDIKNAAILQKNIDRSFVVELDVKKHEFYPKADNVIIMCEKDSTAMNFYNYYSDSLADMNVYVRLNNTDPDLLGKSSIKFFNTYEIVTSNYWKERDLFEYMNGRELNVNIAITDFNLMGIELLRSALLTNLYTLDQKITYHVFGDSVIYRELTSNFKTMNNDKIIFHDEPWYKSIYLLKTMDRIIVPSNNQNRILEYIMQVCTDVDIDFYNPGIADSSKYFTSERLHPFGMPEQCYTYDNIVSDNTYKIAKELYSSVISADRGNNNIDMDEYDNDDINRNYSSQAAAGKSKYDINDERILGSASVNKDDELASAMMDHEWFKLNGFMRASYKSAASFHVTHIKCLQYLKAFGIEPTDEERGREEHVRWCRFYFLHFWNYGVPENGKRGDHKLKIHKNLRPFDELEEEEKRCVIQRAVFFKDIDID